MGPSPQRPATALRRDVVVRLCSHARPPLQMLEDVAHVVRRTVPYAASSWLLTDPVTRLGTGLVAENVELDVQRQFIEYEVDPPRSQRQPRPVFGTLVVG